MLMLHAAAGAAAVLLSASPSCALRPPKHARRSPPHPPCPAQKVLIFSQFKIMLNVLEDYLAMKQYPVERVDGSVKGKDRQVRGWGCGGRGGGGGRGVDAGAGGLRAGPPGPSGLWQGPWGPCLRLAPQPGPPSPRAPTRRRRSTGS
jgi:hypothetical protein